MPNCLVRTGVIIFPFFNSSPTLRSYHRSSLFLEVSFINQERGEKCELQTFNNPSITTTHHTWLTNHHPQITIPWFPRLGDCVPGLMTDPLTTDTNSWTTNHQALTTIHRINQLPPRNYSSFPRYVDYVRVIVTDTLTTNHHSSTTNH